MRYRLVIFDFDGTLANTRPWLLSVANEFADRYGFRHMEPGEEEMLRNFTPAQVLKHFRIPMWKLPWIVRQVRGAMARDIRQITLFDGIAEVISDLATRGVKLAIVSSNSASNVRTVLGDCLAARIQQYECGVSLFGKSARICKVLRRNGVRPNEALLIGDEIRDSEASRLAGVAFGAVGWGFARIEALIAHSPDAVFLAPADILDAIGAY